MNWLEAAPACVDVDGARIAYRRLGRPGGTPVTLLHGGAAHAGWWIDVVPLLQSDCELLVVDLSGHGESEHRSSYDVDLWTREVVSVIDHAGLDSVHIVGHSMGGYVGIMAAARQQQAVRSLLIIDTAVVRRQTGLRPLNRSEVRYYDSLDDAIAHFRLRPRGTVADFETLKAVARLGLREGDKGWRWKFDPRALGRFSREALALVVPGITCEVGFIYGEHSELVNADTVDFFAKLLGRPVAREMVAGVFHHVPLDAPEATAMAIRRTIAAAADRSNGRW